MFSRVLICLVLGSLAVSGCARRAAAPEDAISIESGWTYYRLGEFTRAVHIFEAVQAKAAPGSEEYLQSVYGLAATWNLRLPAQEQDKALAERLYKQLLDQAPQHPLAPWADLALVRLQHLVPVGDEADYSVVRPAYEKIIRKYPGTLTAREAFIYLMSTKVATFETNELKDVVAQLTAFVANTNDTSFFQPAYSLLAVSYNALGQQAERLKAEVKSLETTEIDPTNPFNEFSWQYWNIATIAEFELGDFELARTYYRKLLDEYPRDRRVFAVKQALARMDEMEARIRRELAGGAGS